MSESRIGRVVLPLIAVSCLAACDARETGGDERSIPPIPAQMVPGLYAVGDGTQVYSRTLIKTDGTYEDLDENGDIVGRGTVADNGDTICFDPEGDGKNQEERCWRNDPPDPDGSFVSRRVEGPEHYRVTPLKTLPTK